MLSLSVSIAYGCDICISYFGFNPNYYQNRIGLNYNYLSASGAHQHLNGDAHIHSNDEIEIFQEYSIDGLLFRNNGDQIIFKIPYVRNYSQMNGMQGNQRFGLGDPYIIYQKELIMDVNTSNLIRWNVGGGLEFPLGNFRQNFADPLLEEGSGSWDIILNSNVLIKQEGLGYAITSTFKYNTTNTQSYQFGMQFNQAIDVYYYSKFEAYIPYIGLFYEYGSLDQYDQIAQVNTGGQILYANIGQQFFYRNVSLRYMYQNPFYQKLNGLQATAKEKHTLNFYYYL